MPCGRIEENSRTLTPALVESDDPYTVFWLRHRGRIPHRRLPWHEQSTYARLQNGELLACRNSDSYTAVGGHCAPRTPPLLWHYRLRCAIAGSFPLARCGATAVIWASISSRVTCL